MNIDTRQVKTEKVKEEVMVLSDAVYRDCTKCPHHFIQKSASMAECTMCGLGTWGKAESGKLTKMGVAE